MRMRILAAGVAAACLFPSMAMAQTSCEQQRTNRVVGTVAGAGIGAVVGSNVAGRDNRTAGAVIGALGGGLIGNQLTRGNADCSHAYGYYDNNGYWHTNAVERSAAAGYYDRDGQWVEGAPNGYYDSNNRWVAASSNADASGYYDSKGHYVPASVNGYYDSDGQWVGGAASGYYDSSRRWVSGATYGQYDSNGRWIPGAPSGHRDANNVWIADAQPGYYNSDGRWMQGPANGYYDARGRWIATSYANGDGPGANNDRRWGEAPRDIRQREAWLQQRIVNARSDGSLTRTEAGRSLNSLSSIRQREARMRDFRGRLSPRETSFIQSQLDSLSERVRMQMNS
jgi:hypothetical protein